jgi:hypothetical protein
MWHVLFWRFVFVMSQSVSQRAARERASGGWAILSLLHDPAFKHDQFCIALRRALDQLQGRPGPGLHNHRGAQVLK